ncbi:MAG: L-dopachrome tautomerase-related protein [Oceanospirillaceae bacterium]
MSKILYTFLATFLFCSLSQGNSEKLETVAQSQFAMNGVAITTDKRIFVSMPQWTDQPSPSVGEVMSNGNVIAYPGNQWNKHSPNDAYNRFSNVNAVHTDTNNNLWVVDYAAPFWTKPIKDSQKLVKINTSTNEVERVYRFAENILPTGAKLNDVRIDLNKKVAYISEFGIGALIVVDLNTGKARRLLDKHFSARAHPDVVTYFEGKPFRTDFLHLNDIELDNQGRHLYYQPTGGPVMYRINTDYLLDETLNADQLAQHVEVYSKSLTIGGITKDKNNRLFLGNVQDKAITIIKQGKIVGNLVQDDRLLWPDAMDVHDNYLYIPCPQLKLLAKMNDGISKVRGKFTVYRYPL